MRYAILRHFPVIIIPHHLEATDLEQTTAEFYRQQQCTVDFLKIGTFPLLLQCQNWSIFLTSLQTVLRNSHEIYLLRQSICSYFT